MESIALQKFLASVKRIGQYILETEGDPDLFISLDKNFKEFILENGRNVNNEFAEFKDKIHGLLSKSYNEGYNKGLEDAFSGKDYEDIMIRLGMKHILEEYFRISAKSEAARKASKKKDSWVYFISDGISVKIGFTNDLTRRFDDLQAMNARPLKILAKVKGGAKEERELHLRFASARVQGEWFRLTPELKTYIGSLLIDTGSN